MSSEFERISLLGSLFGSAQPPVSVGIGDDAAIIDVAALEGLGAHLVWTIDSCVEHVHFTRDLLSWQEVGWRSFMAAASDLAAMAAEPLGALCAIALPKDLTDDAFEAIARGQKEAASALGTSIVGGNLSRAAEVSLHTTLLGCSDRPLRRGGARPGDLLVAAGPLGLAAAGLYILQQALPFAEADSVAAVQAWRRPVARIEQGRQLGLIATSQIDVSDGLAQDAGHLAQESRVRIDLDADAIVPPLLRTFCDRHKLEAQPFTLAGGEDFALLATIPPEKRPSDVTVIGRCSEGEGVWVKGSRVDHKGYDHFRQP